MKELSFNQWVEPLKNEEYFMMFRQEMPQEQLRRNYPAIFAESEKETLSDKYLYIPTFKLVEGLEREGFKVIGAKQCNTRKVENREFVKHVVYMTHESMRSDLNVGEELPMLALTNSHNGLSAFGIDTAFFRLACSNGLLMPTTTINSARVTHKKGMQNDVIEASYKVLKSFPEQVAQIQNMKSIGMSSDERIIFAESAQNLAFDDEQIELNKKLGRDIAPKLLTVRRHADQKSDLWTTFNIIQENIIKGGIRVVRENEQGQRSLARTRAVSSIDRDAKLNRELMMLAQKMMQLKTA
jgi:hypothetical protein